MLNKDRIAVASKRPLRKSPKCLSGAGLSSPFPVYALARRSLGTIARRLVWLRHEGKKRTIEWALDTLLAEGARPP